MRGGKIILKIAEAYLLCCIERNVNDNLNIVLIFKNFKTLERQPLKVGDTLQKNYAQYQIKEYVH